MVFKIDTAECTDNQVDAQRALITIADLSHWALLDDGAPHTALKIEKLQ